MNKYIGLNGSGNMNWWSVYARCQAIGGHMPSIQEICPGEIVQGRGCPWLGSTNPWTTTPYDSKRMWCRVGNRQVLGYYNKTEGCGAYCLANES